MLCLIQVSLILVVPDIYDPGRLLTDAFTLSIKQELSTATFT